MLKKYIQVCTLLDNIGPFLPRLKAVQRIIQSSDFIYQKESCPKLLMDTLIRSSYWLEKELFDETHIYANNGDSLSSEQCIHVQMLNIGATLISKGFPLEYCPTDYDQQGPNELSCYAKTFIEQCHKRYAFLFPVKIIQNKHPFRDIKTNQYT